MVLYKLYSICHCILYRSYLSTICQMKKNISADATRFRETRNETKSLIPFPESKSRTIFVPSVFLSPNVTMCAEHLKTFGQDPRKKAEEKMSAFNADCFSRNLRKIKEVSKLGHLGVFSTFN